MATFTGRVSVVVGGREVYGQGVQGQGLEFSAGMASTLARVEADLFGKCDALAGAFGARCACVGRSAQGDALVKVQGVGRVVAGVVVAVSRVD